MSLAENLVAEFARSLALNPEMFAPVVGDQPLWLGSDPRGGLVYLLRVDGGVTVIATWTAVQGENMKRLHDRALYILQSGIGCMR